MALSVQSNKYPMYTNTLANQQSTPHSHYGSEPDQLTYGDPSVRTLANVNHFALFKHIATVTGFTLSEQEKALIAENVKLKKLRKRQYFLQEGDICKYIGFVVRGSTRMFSINERGQESIISFGIENCWVADHESFRNGGFSTFHIEALEDAELLIMNCSQLDMLMKSVPSLGMLFRNYQVEQMIDCQKRINAALSMTAEERYIDLINSKPHYAQRFSQNMLACYLGVKPETLSRIRNR